ncbi:MAG: hypothetical protein HUJ73_01530, partial [Eubacterium sp.]|nr:hypothetical protein [Eubacterium sp.]
LKESSLASYMIPDDYVFLEKMPLTPNGKVDRKALPLPEIREEEYEEPEGEMEQAVASAAGELLGIERIGSSANLLSLGMSSLLFMKLVLRLNEEKKIRIRTADAMKAPTVREIAALAARSMEEEEIRVDYTLREAYPITENQRGLFVDWEKNPGTTQYNIPSVFRFGPETDGERLTAAVKAAIDAHSYLKTTFALSEDDVMQIRRDNEEAVVTHTLLEAEPSEEELAGRVYPFHLTGGELCRAEVIESPESVYLFLDIHHTVIDGISVSILMNDIERAYRGETLAAETHTAYENALYEKALSGTERYRKAEKFFDALLSGAETTRYPVSARVDEGREKTSYVSYRIDNRSIAAFCRKNSITPNAYFCTSFMYVLSCAAREETVLIAFIDNGRNRAGIMGSVGMFVRTIPMVLGFEGENGFAAMARECQERQSEAVSHSIYPFTQLVSRYGITPEILYAYQGLEGPDRNGLFAEAQSIPLTLDTAKVPLTLEVVPEEDGFRLMVEYDTALYSRRDMETLIKMIGLFAEQAAVEPDVRRIALTDEAEQQALLKLGTGRQKPYDPEETFIDLFLKQAARTPERTAVCDG